MIHLPNPDYIRRPASLNPELAVAAIFSLSWKRVPEVAKYTLHSCLAYCKMARTYKVEAVMLPAKMKLLLIGSLCLIFLAGAAIRIAGQIAPAFPAAKLGGGGDNYMHNFYLPPASSTPFYPAWSPTGKVIVFSMHGSIWKIKVGETTAYELTAGPTYDSSPAWSPDGKWIVYTAEEDSRRIQLRILDLATGETHSLATGEHLYLDPVWSPAGQRLAYVSTQPDGRFNIFVTPIKEGRLGKPIPLTTGNDYGSNRLYFGNIDIHIEPTWSPDGKEIIFLSNRGIPLGSGALWRGPVEPNGGAKARKIHREETLYRTRPDWSPDGARILYSSHLGGQFNNLFVLPAEGGEPYKMTFDDWDHFHPRWSPDGHRIVYISNQRGLTELRILETFSGRDSKVDIRQKRYRRPMGWLKVRVLDAATGRPTPARIYAEASDGKTYAPEDAFHRVGLLQEHLFHTDGTFSLAVPPGRMKVEAVKGFEHHPVSQQVNITANEVTDLTLTLTRMTDLAIKGWYGGSTHVHMNYGGNLHNTPENLMFMAAAEDLDIVGELVANKDNRILDYQFFRGGLDPLSTDERLLYFNEEYRPPFYGHISLLNLTEHLISPFTTGYEGTAIESLYPSNTDIFRIARKQGAIGGYVHPYSTEPSEGDYGVARAFPVDTALGVLEYLEVMSGTDHLITTRVWHRILNCGFKVSAVAGEDSISNLHRTSLVGINRTYAYAGPKLDWDAWIEAIRKGHTFVTNGPLLEFTVNERESGEEIHLPAHGGKVRVRGSMQSTVPVEKVEIVNNGEVIADIPLTGKGEHAHFSQEIEVRQSGWYTLRAYGTRPVHPVDDRYPFAETGPIYVYCGDRPIRSAEDARYFLTWIDAISKMAAEHPGWRSEKEKSHVLGQFREARKIFEQRAHPASP